MLSFAARRSARVVGVLAATAVLLGLSAVAHAGSALAATTIGQTGTPTAFFAGGSDTVQNDAAMPMAGVVTSLNTQSAAACHSVGTYDLQVLQPLGGNQYQLLGDTGNKTDPCDGQLHSYPVNIPVQAGDVLGVYVVSDWLGGMLLPGSENFGTPISEPGVGDTVTLPNPSRP
jgi:hypothetical protein